MTLLLVPFLIAVALLVYLYFLFKLVLAAALWRKDTALKNVFWESGVMSDGIHKFRVSINMAHPHGCFYQVRIHSLYHIVRRWFLGKGFKRLVMCHYHHLTVDGVHFYPLGSTTGRPANPAEWRQTFKA